MSATPAAFDVAVVGAGPAGIAAAVRAAEAGARVVVIDEGFGPGGQIWRPGRIARPRRAERWVARLEVSGATVLMSAAVVDARALSSGGFRVRVESAEGARDLVVRRVVLATGARELFLPFPGWTLPNVMGIGGAQALLKSGMSFRGKRVVLSGSGPLMLPVAASLAKAGAKLLVVAEQAPAGRVFAYAAKLWRKPRTLVQAAALRWEFIRARYATGTWISKADGDDSVRTVTLTDDITSRTLECDVVCTGFGLVPNVELGRLLGCNSENGALVVDSRQQTNVRDVYAVGEPTGIGGVDLAVVEGEIGGLAAAGGATDARLVSQRARLARDAVALGDAFRVRDEVRRLATPDTIVCRCEDVRFGALDPRWTARQAKLYTRVGMGPCQGRICGAALECVMGWRPDSVRPPVEPARVSTLMMDSVQAAGSLPNDLGVH